ncbi:hypothetical protein SBV42_03640 [Chlamydia crocodili]|uniref:Uncharacterized protein n=1 Tax=Chlamydia crocodili TaxID=2766982 RepID=A0ABX8CCX1_9CHLA|nr:hypothetical protein [Chlamydia crocodili]QVE48855.1 hypothetical protein H9Q19_04010 [Chlamydia crocodili]
METWLYYSKVRTRNYIPCLPILSPIMLQADQCLPTLYLSPFSRCCGTTTFVASVMG